MAVGRGVRPSCGAAPPLISNPPALPLAGARLLRAHVRRIANTVTVAHGGGDEVSHGQWHAVANWHAVVDGVAHGHAVTHRHAHTHAVEHGHGYDDAQRLRVAAAAVGDVVALRCALCLEKSKVKAPDACQWAVPQCCHWARALRHCRSVSHLQL